MTASSRSSNATGDPSGTRRTSIPRSAGAGAVKLFRRCDPGRRPSSRVSSTSGALGSRRTSVHFLAGAQQTRISEPRTVSRGAPTGRGAKNRPQGYRREGAAAKTGAVNGVDGHGSAVEVVGQRDPVDLVGGDLAEDRGAGELLPAAADRLGGALQGDLEVRELGVHVVVGLPPYGVRLGPGPVHDLGGLT